MGEKLSIDHYTIILMLTYINTNTYNDLTLKNMESIFAFFHSNPYHITMIINNIFLA